MLELAVITINIDPTIELGPVTLSWHGLGIAVGIAAGWALARRYAVRNGLDRDRVSSAVLVIALAGVVGAKLFYLLLNTPAGLLRPADWVASHGFAFYGALIFGTAAVGFYLVRNRLSLRYLDALAYGFPLGMAVGRIGDVISGEHYGPPSDAPWAFRYLNPGAEVPSSRVAYHSGALYEIAVAVVMLPVVLVLAQRLRRPGLLLWSVIALYGLGRLLIFFYRSDSEPFALGLNAAQATSLALIAAAAVGAWASTQQHKPSLSFSSRKRRN